MNWLSLTFHRYGILTIAFVLLGAAVHRSARQTVEGRVVEYGRPWKVLFIFVLATLAFMIAGVVFQETVTDWRGPAVYSVFVLWLGSEIYFRKLVIHDLSFSVTSLWFGTKELLWRDIREIEYSRGWRTYRFQDRDGKWYHLNPAMSGTAEFLAVARDHGISVMLFDDAA